MTLWRISNHADLAGLGGERADGRWHTAGRGQRIVYLSEHPALALVEVLVHLHGDPRFFPTHYRLLRVEIAERITVQRLREETLGSEWKDRVSFTRGIGDEWLSSGQSALLSVPSVAVPESSNFLLNPIHREARGAEIVGHSVVEFDTRLRRLFGV